MTSAYKYPELEINGLQARAMKAAAHVLEINGVDGLNLRAIAAEARIGIASMYHYFKSKDEILLGLALEGFEDLRHDMLRKQACLEFAASPSRGAAKAYFDFIEARPALFSVMCSERLAASYPELRAAEYRMFQTYEAAVVKDDRVAAPYRQNVAYALWALGRGMAAIRGSYPDGVLPPDISLRLAAGVRYLIDRAD
jgi:AcrR family transcriptional regulator